jgi:uncharacterized protein
MQLLRLRFFPLWLLASLLLPCAVLQAEKVADLPMPDRYVEDFAGVLTPQGKQQIEDLCLEVHRQANAELEVVTIKSLDDGETVEDFTVSLEEKWKIGKKGVDRSALILLVMNPHKLRVETGYGLEGILPDAEVGRILDQAVPDAKRGDYDEALLTIVQETSDVIANDAHVELTPITHTYHQQVVPDRRVTPGQVIGGIIVLLILAVLIGTGHGGWIVWILLNMIGGRGGGGGGGGWGDGDSGGGFGGSGGGESGGGGASRDF